MPLLSQVVVLDDGRVQAEVDETNGVAEGVTIEESSCGRGVVIELICVTKEPL